jgi:hypothetical protein
MGVWLPDGWIESAPAGFPLPPLIPPLAPLLSPQRGEKGGQGLTSVGFCHRGVNAWTEGRQGEVGRGSSPPKNPFFGPFPAL